MVVAAGGGPEVADPLMAKLRAEPAADGKTCVRVSASIAPAFGFREHRPFCGPWAAALVRKRTQL